VGLAEVAGDTAQGIRRTVGEGTPQVGDLDGATRRAEDPMLRQVADGTSERVRVRPDLRGNVVISRGPLNSTVATSSSATAKRA
jgi:hypothetical protein